MTLKIAACLLCSGGSYPHYGGGRFLLNVDTFPEDRSASQFVCFFRAFILPLVFECWPSTVAQTQTVTTVFRREVYLSDKQLAGLTVLRSSMVNLSPGKCLNSSQNHFLACSATLPLTRSPVIQCHTIWAATEITVALAKGSKTHSPSWKALFFVQSRHSPHFMEPLHYHVHNRQPPALSWARLIQPMHLISLHKDPF